MKKLNRPFEPITTLIIIYFALVAVSIELYALIQIFVSDKNTASSLLGWTATMFATIALLYTFKSWRIQKSSDVLSDLSKEIYFLLDQIKSNRDDIYKFIFRDEDHINLQFFKVYEKILTNLEIINEYIENSSLDHKISKLKKIKTSINIYQTVAPKSIENGNRNLLVLDIIELLNDLEDNLEDIRKNILINIIFHQPIKNDKNA